MLAMNSTDVRKDWSREVDSVVRDKPTIIKRTRDRMWLSNLDTMSDILEAYQFTAARYTEDDGSVTLSLDDYFIASYTKPATFDTISTYVVNATKGSQTDIKTALWALSTLIFVIVILVVVVMNLSGKGGEKRRGKEDF